MELGRDDRRTGLAVTDDLTKATLTIVWVIILNKPFYPLYVWYLVDAGAAEASLVTLLSLPFFLAIPLLAKKSRLAARVALPVVGTLDTLFETAIFGHPSGTEFFFAACIMLAALSFHAEEKLWQYAIAILVFIAFVCSRTFLGAAVQSWSADDLATLLNLNAFSAASLMAFIALRYAGLSRRTET
ncbi:hypothetical protein O9X81_24395 [Agrobacterium salinitolerans]|uniref:hypothetical protein n=1 Tax=Agrobacterium salinitolerans TaxID=1183413 RepID=UPI0022B81689|nr:hypothetical protein [Agrobacterium salinitolerans]MCZ7859740.1 hypothetical protein [Agrobacterium salinitolerans]